MTKKITFSLLAIIVSGCLILSAGLIAGAWFLLRAQKNYEAPPAEPTEVLTIDEQMDRIQGQVSEIRGLEMNSTLDRAMMTTDELEDVVTNDFFKDVTPEDIQNEVHEKSVIGLLPEDFDLLQFYKDLYSEQIAGYYDNETKEMYVITDEGFNGTSRDTYAHEYTHVLQDQNYDLTYGLKINDEYCEAEPEYCAAVTALVEGDAYMTEQYWLLRDSSDQDKTDISEFQSSFKMPVYDSAPAYMKEDFLFPYLQGFYFVQALYKDNKWKSIDEAYQNPPVSTEQILHPEKYPDDVPSTVETPDLLPLLGEGWTEIDRNVMGEWYSYLILAFGFEPDTRLDEESAKTATAGWGGDQYVYYQNSSTSNYVFYWNSTWESVTDAEEFFSSSKEYGSLRWGDAKDESSESVTWSVAGGVNVTVRYSGSDIFWLISDDLSAYQQVMTNLDGLEG